MPSPSRPTKYLSFLFVIAAACSNSPSKTETVESGRLQFVKTLKYGRVGTHGSNGWYVSEKRILVAGREWKPENLALEDVSDCEASPSLSVEALKCTSFADLRESTYVLTVKGNTPSWTVASSIAPANQKNLGEWTEDGRWLLFLNYFYNVQSAEKREVKGLPDHPGEHFLAASPDLRMIIFGETGFLSRFDLPPNADMDEEIRKQFDEWQKRSERGIHAWWLIDTIDGTHSIIELRREKYDWLFWDREKFPMRSEWLRFLRSQLKWERNSDGKSRLVYPN